MKICSLALNSIQNVRVLSRCNIDLPIKIGCVIVTFSMMPIFLLPIGVQIDQGKQPSIIYKEDFPFAEKRMNASGVEINRWHSEAQEISERVHAHGKQVNPFKRVLVADSILSCSTDMFYKFMPAYSQTLNTAPIWSAEIPKSLKNIFIDHHKKKAPMLRIFHPELNPLYLLYQEDMWIREGQKREALLNTLDYLEQVVILPHKNGDAVMQNLLAEEGSDTPRAFLTGRVLRVQHEGDEYLSLKKILAQGGRLTDQITTSDPHFAEIEAQTVDAGLPLHYTLTFERDDPEHVVLQLSSDTSAYLVLLDTWTQGWKAFVDGKETPIYRGYIGARFINAPQGDHRIEFTYKTPGLGICLRISIISWLIILGLMVGVTFKNTKER